METSTIPFDKFKVVRKLGRGGMGTVYEAQDPALERRVAIKTLTTDAFADAESRKRFEREARAAAKLQHPNIVTIYELGNFGRKDKPYIVMEYLEGSDLTSFIGGEHPMAFGEALDVAAQLCRALDFAHQHDVVHRDVKPSNIRLLDDGRVKIMDFGIARIEGGDQITRSGVMVGTPHYMSPEQIKGGKIDGRSDVFSAGCILYEMLAGRRPFHGDTAPTVLYKIVNEPPPPLLKKKPNLPQEVEDVLNRALAKNPEDRFQSAGEMAAELDKLLRVHHLSFPRVPADLQKRLDRLERCRRDRNWSEARAMARELVTERPELPSPRRILRTADRMLRLQEEQSRLTPAQKTRDLVEISDELTQLYGPGQQPTVVEAKMETRLEEELTAGKLKLRTKAAPVPEDVRPNALLKIAAAVVVIAVLGMGAWYIFQSSAGPQQITQTVRISSEPPGSSIFVNGVQKGVVTETGQRVEVLLEGEEGDSFTIELRKAGYSPVQTQVQLGAAPPPPLELTLDPLPVAYLISTRPAGATVRLDGAQLPEMTPVEVGLTPHEAHELALSKEGYESQTLNIGPGEEPPGDRDHARSSQEAGNSGGQESLPTFRRLERRGNIGRAVDQPFGEVGSGETSNHAIRSRCVFEQDPVGGDTGSIFCASGGPTAGQSLDPGRAGKLQCEDQRYPSRGSSHSQSGHCGGLKHLRFRMAERSKASTNGGSESWTSCICNGSDSLRLFL